MLSRIEGAIATRKAGSTDVAWEVHTRKPQPVNLRQHGVVLFNRVGYSPAPQFTQLLPRLRASRTLKASTIIATPTASA